MDEQRRILGLGTRRTSWGSVVGEGQGATLGLRESRKGSRAVWDALQGTIVSLPHSFLLRLVST